MAQGTVRLAYKETYHRCGDAHLRVQTKILTNVTVWCLKALHSWVCVIFKVSPPPEKSAAINKLITPRCLDQKDPTLTNNVFLFIYVICYYNTIVQFSSLQLANLLMIKFKLKICSEFVHFRAYGPRQMKDCSRAFYSLGDLQSQICR